MANVIGLTAKIISGAVYSTDMYINPSKIISVADNTFMAGNSLINGSVVMYNKDGGMLIYCSNSSSSIKTAMASGVTSNVLVELTDTDEVGFSFSSDDFDFAYNTSEGVFVVVGRDSYYVEETLSEVYTAMMATQSDIPVKSGAGLYSIVTKEPNGASASGIASVSFHTGVGSGNHSMAWGELNEAQGENSTSFGVSCVSHGNDSASCGIGSITEASARGSFAHGEATITQGECSESSGKESIAYYDNSNAYSIGANGQRIMIGLQGETVNTATTNLVYSSSKELDLSTANNPKLWDVSIRLVGVNASNGAYFTKWLKSIYTSSLGTITTTEVSSQVSASLSGVAYSVSKVGDLVRISVTGVAATTLTWYAHIEIVEIH
jgi:hypothetical protein